MSGKDLQAGSGSTEVIAPPDWLLPFQDEDVRKLVDRRSILIANEMGTGKTYEAIALDLMRRSTKPEGVLARTLIVAPMTILQSTWADHYEELAPDLRVIVIDPKNRGVFLKALKSNDYDVYILHWDVLRIIEEQLKEIIWFHIIADEAHRAKNRKAQQTRSLKRLRTAWRTAMTGTPVMNKPQDLWSILNWLYKETWSSYWKYYQHYVEFEIIYPHGYHKIHGPKNEKFLREKMDPYFIRRTKEEVLPDLPEKYYSKIEVDLLPLQRKAYDEMKRDMIAWLETQDGQVPLPAPVVIAQLIRLQQFSLAYASIVTEDMLADGVKGPVGRAILTEPSSKVDVLFQIIQDNPDEPLVIFSQFRQAIALVEARLDTAGIRYVRITGDDSARDRVDAVADFQSGKASIFLGTIGAGSEGITLTRASTVIFLDRDWTPARNAQAEDRLHRFGQKSAVQVIDIMARDTVDQYRFKIIEMKKEWIRRMLDD